MCVCVSIYSPRRKTRIRRGGEREDALSLSVRLFLTAAISLIRLWRNRNLALHRPNLPLPLSRCISLTQPFLCLLLLHRPLSLSPLPSSLSVPSVHLSHFLLLIKMDISPRCRRDTKGKPVGEGLQGKMYMWRGSW